MIKRLAAMIYTLSDRTMDPEAIADSMRLIMSCPPKTVPDIKLEKEGVN